MDDPVLSYHDVLLRQEVVALLQGSNWLNDQVSPLPLSVMQRYAPGTFRYHINLVATMPLWYSRIPQGLDAQH